MVKSADDKLYPDIRNKSQDWKITIIEMYQTVVSCGVFPPPPQCSAGATNDAMCTIT